MTNETEGVPQSGGIDKIKRYNWTVKDQPGIFMWVDKNKLVVDDTYQRTYNKIKAQTMASGWSYIACGTITVGHRYENDIYTVIDGQHRVIASRSRSDIKRLPCMVFEVSSLAQEASGFLNTNKCRKPIKIYDTFRAQLVANDPDTIYIKSVFDTYGIVIVSNISGARGKSLKAVSSCFEMVKDRQHFEQTIELVSELCRDTPIYDRLLQGIYYLSRNLETDLSNNRLRNRIIKIGPADLIKSINRECAYFDKGGARVYAMGIINEVNKGLRTRFRFKEEVKP